MARLANIAAVEKRIADLREWLKKEAPECFTEQKHTEEGTQERIYWHHGYMMGLVDVLRLLTSNAPNQKSRNEDRPDASSSA